MVLRQKQRQLQSAAEVAALQSLSMESRQQEGSWARAHVTQDSLSPTSPEISSVTLSTKETFWMRGGDNWGGNHAIIKVSVTSS